MIWRRRRGRAAGQALVEFAFVFPIIAMLAFAAVDIGRAVFTWNTLTAAARESSRVASVNQLDPADGPWRCLANHPVEDPADPTWTFRGCAMQVAATLGVEADDVTISYEPPPGTDLTCAPVLNVGCILTVTVVTTFEPITPVAGQLIGSIPMTSTSSKPIERLFP